MGSSKGMSWHYGNYCKDCFGGFHVECHRHNHGDYHWDHHWDYGGDCALFWLVNGTVMGNILVINDHHETLGLLLNYNGDCHKNCLFDFRSGPPEA